MTTKAPDHLHMLAQMWDQIAEYLPSGWECTSVGANAGACETKLCIELRGWVAHHAHPSDLTQYQIAIRVRRDGSWHCHLWENFPRVTDHGEIPIEAPEPGPWLANLIHQLAY